MKNKKKAATVILWTARIWGSLSLVFMLFFVGAALVGTITGKGDGIGGFKSLSDRISFLFFPVLIMIGLGVAWRWEGLGGFLTTAGIIVFYAIRPDLLSNPYIAGLAFPGLLFILYWFLSRNLSEDKSTTYNNITT
ncbi:MAG: hypothetical protein IH591_11205 [Bacteroidales bacterium]|nr:hypothetical protein [Bacteroidales bacterium]